MMRTRSGSLDATDPASEVNQGLASRHGPRTRNGPTCVGVHPPIGVFAAVVWLLSIAAIHGHQRIKDDNNIISR